MFCYCYLKFRYQKYTPALLSVSLLLFMKHETPINQYCDIHTFLLHEPSSIPVNHPTLLYSPLSSVRSPRGQNCYIYFKMSKCNGFVNHSTDGLQCCEVKQNNTNHNTFTHSHTHSHTQRGDL